MSEDEIRYIKYRQRYLPRQIEDTRRKLENLEREAKRYGIKV